MDRLPLISIVTPSFNQGDFIGQTLQSLVDQDYPRLEVIIQEGGSKDDSLAIAQDFARRYPEIFHVHAERDHGQAHALNLGFAKARGEILGFLNSDDTLLPGCLRGVAREIDPGAGRCVVFGRCLFTGEEGAQYVGVEHPAEFAGHFEQLAIWKRGYNTLPQPSVFWHRKVWERCGGLNESESHVLDYDLFCRFSRHFDFCKVDELWSTYRLHPASKSAQRSETEVLALSIAASRRNWPGWAHPLRWRLEASYRLHDRHAYERARHHARRAEALFAEKRTGAAMGEFFQTLTLSPRMAWHRLLQPLLAGRGLHWLEKLVWRRDAPGEEFTGHYPDGWIGPVYRQALPPAASDASMARVRLQHVPQGDGRHGSIHAELRLNGRLCASRKIEEGGPFEISADFRRFRAKGCSLELRVWPYFVPSAISESGDNRQLTALLLGVEVS